MKKLIFVAIMVFTMLGLTNAKAQESVAAHNYQKAVHHRNRRIRHHEIKQDAAQRQAYQDAVHRRNARIRQRELRANGH